jgi:hypothetical protein
MILPLWLRAALAATILTAILGICWWVHHTIWKSGYNAAMVEVAVKSEALRVLQQEGIDSVSSTFVSKAAKQRAVAQSNTEKVAQYVPPTDCPLSAGFRLLYDANATGKEVDDSGRATATAVTAQDVARTTGQNFAICRYDQDRLEALQAIVKTINGD